MTTTIDDKIILMDIPMPIETPRLILRPVQTGDGAEMYKALQETRDVLLSWMPWAKDEITADQYEAKARRGYAKFLLREDFWLVGIERQTGTPVLWTGLHRPKWDIPQFAIGYWVRKTAQGKGYATESANALIRYAFNALGARRIEIGHAGGNEKSRRVIKKLGLELESVRKLADKLPDGSFVDDYYYARLNTDGLPPLDVRWGS